MNREFSTVPSTRASEPGGSVGVASAAAKQNPASKKVAGLSSPDELAEIAANAYTYAYPLILMEMTRRVSTNVADTGAFGKAPMNQFSHAPAFPDAAFTDIVRPNADTLYSTLWYDVSTDPLLVGVPDSGGRYFLLPMLDMWTDVFASPGKRTTGTQAQLIAIVGPSWQGALPPEALVIRSPTAVGWMLGRTQTNGEADYEAVHQFQHGITTTPLSEWGKPKSAAAAATINADWDMKTPPVGQVEKLTPEEYFALFASLTKANPPHANDYPIIEQMGRLGIEPGRPFAHDAAPADVRDALAKGKDAALAKIRTQYLKSGAAHEGWHTNLTAVGTYGADYLNRATVAFAGLGANRVEDAVYPTASADSDGKPLDSAHRYVLHFSKDEVPPVRGFWSLTMYDERQLFTANSINRYAIGDRDKLAFNSDGSLDLAIQRQSPGNESNWLPAPASGEFSMNLRLYWPKGAVLDGGWIPPGVKRID